LTSLKAGSGRMWQAGGNLPPPMPTLDARPAITPDSKIGDIVASRPALARIFEQLGLDYCCGGKQKLAEACARRGLAVDTVTIILEAAGQALAENGIEIDAAAMTLTELADHIESTHHAYVKTELPRLLEMAERVARKHEHHDARLREVAATVQDLTNEMFSHMHKEEAVLFPLVRQIDSGAAGQFHCGSIANPIRQMEAEHESAGGAVARLRLLTDGFTPPADGCNTHRVLLAGLAEFESDLHRHVHKENNILFPRALERAAAAE
jgi:regulator of cell morphogenesis and NO signaling